MFRDRIEAGQKLAEKIAASFPLIKKGFILALPRGGVAVASELAERLNLPMDIIVTRKIGAPLNPEYAVAAVSSHQTVLNKRENVDAQYLKEQESRERQEIQRRMKEYRGKRPYPRLRDKTVILVDDGLATGLTMQTAILEVKTYKPLKIILAVPVAPPDTVLQLKTTVDKTIVLQEEPMFFAIGQFYQNFEQVSDEEVKTLLNADWQKWEKTGE